MFLSFVLETDDTFSDYIFQDFQTEFVFLFEDF